MGAFDKVDKTASFLTRGVSALEDREARESQPERIEQQARETAHPRTETVPSGVGDRGPLMSVQTMERHRASEMPKEMAKSTDLIHPSPEVGKVLDEYTKSKTDGIDLKEAGQLMKDICKLKSEQLQELHNYVRNEAPGKLDFNPQHPGTMKIDGQTYTNLSMKPGEVVPGRVEDLSKSSDPLDKRLNKDLSESNCHKYALWNACKDSPDARHAFEQLDWGNKTVNNDLRMTTLGFEKVDPTKGLKAGDVVTASFDHNPIGDAVGPLAPYKHSGVVRQGENGLLIREKIGSEKDQPVCSQTPTDFNQSWANGDPSKITVWRRAEK
jgi:hypothetical protein